MLKNKYPYFLIIPSFFYILLFFIFPMVWLFIVAFSSVDLRTWSFNFVGFKNFEAIIREEEFIPSLIRTILYGTYIAVGGSVIGLLLALLANQKLKGISIFRGVLIIPWSIPPVISGYLWAWMFDSNFGFLNRLLYSLRLINNYITFITKDAALMIVSMPVIWMQSSFTGLICLSALQGIPTEIYEASEIDGATSFKKFLHIIFPFIRPTWALTFLVNLMTGFIMFDIIYVMTAGGPGTSTLTLPILLYRLAFLMLRINPGAALAVTHLALILIVGTLYLLVLYKRRE
jgi:multiple sugar transport system permease protein